MRSKALLYYGVLLFGVFVSAVSQVLLKKAAQKKYKNIIWEYLNPQVVIAYLLFVFTTFLSIFAYRGIPLSLGPLLETTSYIYITIFGITFFKEKITKRKAIALMFIVIGIVINTAS